MQNAYGEVREAEVIEATYTRATINRIQFDTVRTQDILDWAEPGSVTVHPEFQEQAGRVRLAEVGWASVRYRRPARR